MSAILAATAGSLMAATTNYDDADEDAASSTTKLQQPVRQASARVRPIIVRQEPTIAAPQPPADPQSDIIGEVAPANLSATQASSTANACAGPSCGSDLCPSCDQCGGPSGCCKCCCRCGPPGRFWVRDEYLGFFTRGDNLPMLVSTTAPGGTLPATTPVFGGNTVNTGYRSGNWIQAGMWLDPCCQNWGIQGNYFFLGTARTNFFDQSNGNPVLARPFINANTGLPSQQLVALNGTVVGSVAVSDYSSFQGAGANLRKNLCCKTYCDDCCDANDDCPWLQNCCRIDAVGGFQYYNFTDNLNVSENLVSTSTTNGVPIGTSIMVNDSFRTTNNFYGGNIGLIADRYHGRWVAEGSLQVALGSNVQRVSINGNTTVTAPLAAPVVNQGGLLAQSTNIGTYSHSNFTAIPQASARLGYRVTETFTVFAGYTLIYWGQVARAADQIDPVVNPNLLPPSVPGGPARPAFNLHETGFFAHGLTLGGQINF